MWHHNVFKYKIKETTTMSKTNYKNTSGQIVSAKAARRAERSSPNLCEN